MPPASAILAVAGGGVGFVAARLWLKSSFIEVRPLWERLGRMEPVDPTDAATQRINALVEGAEKSAALNKRAARWTALAALAGAGAAILSAFGR